MPLHISCLLDIHVSSLEYPCHSQDMQLCQARHVEDVGRCWSWGTLVALPPGKIGEAALVTMYTRMVIVHTIDHQNVLDPGGGGKVGASQV